jgi:sec-independent protein translocase protein TatC
MNVWDHLGELRRRLLICIYALIAGTGFGAWAVNPVIGWLARPVGELVFVHPTEAFAAQMKIALGVSFLICLPLLLYQAWAFASTGLKENEKRYMVWAIPASYFFFMGGFAFSTFWVFPRAVEFLMTLKSSHLQPMLTVESYLDFFILLGMAFGLLFQLPICLHFLAKMGVLREEFLTHNRRISYLGIFILAALVNPVPEIFTMLLLSLGAVTLFEFSIFLIRIETRSKRK